MEEKKSISTGTTVSGKNNERCYIICKNKMKEKNVHAQRNDPLLNNFSETNKNIIEYDFQE